MVGSPIPGQSPTCSAPLGWSSCPSLHFLICKVESLLNTWGSGVLSNTPFLSVVLALIQGQNLRRKGFLLGLHSGGTPAQRHPQTYRDSSWIHSLVGSRARERLGSLAEHWSDSHDGLIFLGSVPWLLLTIGKWPDQLG